MNIVEIIGIVAIVVSLLFVAYELRLSNRIAMREARSNILSSWTDISKPQFEDENVASLFTKLREHNCELSEQEKTRAMALASLYLGICGHINSASQSGMLNGGVLEVHLNILSFQLQEFPGVAPFMSEYLKRVVPGKVEGLVANDRALEEIARIVSENGT